MSDLFSRLPPARLLELKEELMPLPCGCPKLIYSNGTVARDLRRALDQLIKHSQDRGEGQ